MKKALLIFISILLAHVAFSQADSDNDGVPDSEDLCPMLKGPKVNKGCPAEKNKPGASANETKPAGPVTTVSFIEKNVFESILESVCENSVAQKIKGNIKPVNNKSYETVFPQNGPRKNLGVYYLQASDLRFSAVIGLSENPADLSKAAAFINGLLESSETCRQDYRNLKLVYDDKSKKYEDVYAWEDCGIFMFVELEKGKVQLRINKINYAEKETGKTAPVPASSASKQSFCSELEKVMSECVNGFKNSTGSFVKKETPSEFYSTTLPPLGFDKKHVVKSIDLDVVNDEFVRNVFVYYSADKPFSDQKEALRFFEQTKSALRNCYSGTVNFSDESNQKIYELFTTYKGKSIRIALIYLNFFSSSVAFSVRLTE